jgi:hypothetical protein
MPHAGGLQGTAHCKDDVYSMYNSTIGEEEFTFDDELVTSQVYRRVLYLCTLSQSHPCIGGS